MDATRVHLFITHLPVFGLFLSILALIYGVIKKERQVKIVSLLILIIAVVGGIISFQTGHEAEETAEKITGISEAAIEEHEESAETTVIFFYALGAIAMMSLYAVSADKSFARPLLIGVLVVSALAFYYVAQTASLGGKIRHTEISGQDTGAVIHENGHDD